MFYTEGVWRRISIFLFFMQKLHLQYGPCQVLTKILKSLKSLWIKQSSGCFTQRSLSCKSVRVVKVLT